MFHSFYGSLIGLCVFDLKKMLSLELSNYSKLFMYLASQLNKLKHKCYKRHKNQCLIPYFFSSSKIPSNQKK